MNFFMKSALLLTGISMFLMPYLYGSQVTVTFRPEKPEAGENLSVKISVEDDSFSRANFMGGRDPVILPRLENASWVPGVSNQGFSSFTDASGKTVSRMTFTRLMRLEKPGKLNVPPIKVYVNGKTLAAQAFTVDVAPAGTTAASRKQSAKNQKQLQPYAVLTAAPDDRTLSVGETIALKLELFIPPGCEVSQMSFPQITGVNGAVMLESPSGHRQDRRYEISDAYTRTIKGVPWRVMDFAVRLKVMNSGTLQPEARIQLTVLERVSSSGSDDASGDDMDEFSRMFSFFGSSFARRSRRETLQAKLEKSLTVAPLPAAPEGFFDLGLVGNWKIRAALKQKSCRVGEIAEAELSGVCLDKAYDMGALRIPELRLPDMRCYPAEVKKEGSSFVVRYPVVPLAAGKRNISLKLCYYSPSLARYEKLEFSLPLDVLPAADGAVNISASKSAAPAAATRVADGEKTAADSSFALPAELHYQKSDTDDFIRVPLVKNQLLFITLLLLGGVGIIVFSIARHRLQKYRESGDPARKKLKQQVRLLRRKIDRRNAFELMRQGGLATIASAMGLPPGATASEIAGQLDDPELQNFFMELASSGFAPASANAAEKGSVPLEKLTAMLKKLGLALFLLPLLCLGSSGAEKGDAFDKGNYAQALENYSRSLRSDAVSPSLCYNIGNCYYRMGDLPRARVWLTRAALLAPGDRAIRDNLLAAEEKLQLVSPEADRSFASVVSSWRDLLRPDQYLLVAAWALFLLCLIFTLRARMSKGNFIGGTVAIFLVLALSLFAALDQQRTSYAREKMILTGKTVELRSLPVSQNRDIRGRFPGGTDAELISRRGDWLLVKISGTEGWIENSDAMQVFPYGVF